MTITENYCTECGQVSTATTPHCSNCGAEDPWDERPAYRFNEDDLPFVFSMEMYDDHRKLWRSFCSAYFGTDSLREDDISGLTENFPPMKYCVFDVYFVVTESYELEGPFLDESEAREVGT